MLVTFNTLAPALRCGPCKYRYGKYFIYAGMNTRTNSNTFGKKNKKYYNKQPGYIHIDIHIDIQLPADLIAPAFLQQSSFSLPAVATERPTIDK